MAEREPHPVAPAKTTQRRGEMKRESRHPIWSWVIHTPWVLAVIALLSVIAFFGSGAGNPFLRRLIVHRFVLGPENLSQRTSRGTAAYSHPSRQERLDERAGTAALHFRKQAAARDALRPAHPPRKASERLDSLQRSADAARDGGKRSAAGAGRRRIARPSTLSRESRLAVRTVHGDAKSSPASEYFREIHIVA